MRIIRVKYGKIKKKVYPEAIQTKYKSDQVLIEIILRGYLMIFLIFNMCELI